MARQDILDWFRNKGYTGYGATVDGAEVRAFLGLTMPEVGTKSQYDAVALAELAAIGYVRDALLEEGKYLKGDQGSYRVLLPSENAAQVEVFMANAGKKLRRAQRLAESTPSEFRPTNDNAEARLAMMQKSIKETNIFGNVSNAL